MIVRIMAFCDCPTQVAWSAVSRWTRVEVLKYLADDVYGDVLSCRRLVDYDSYSNETIRDYKIADLESLVNLTHLVNSSRLRSAVNVTISLKRTWYEMLKDPLALVKFAKKISSLSQLLPDDRRIAHTIRLEPLWPVGWAVECDHRLAIIVRLQ